MGYVKIKKNKLMVIWFDENKLLFSAIIPIDKFIYMKYCDKLYLQETYYTYGLNNLINIILKEIKI